MDGIGLGSGIVNCDDCGETWVIRERWFQWAFLHSLETGHFIRTHWLPGPVDV